MTALLLLPLMAFTGFAVDMGAWYARATEIQRTADAASLAGVAFIPIDDDQAVDAAIAVARQNGFIDGQDGVSVSVAPLEGDRVRVSITDASVPQYFTSLFRDEVSVTRSSTAEYVPPIRMGSPRNFLGTGRLPRSVSGLPEGAVLEEFTLAVNGPCDRKEDGDLRLSLRMGNHGSGNPPHSHCTAGEGNDDYEVTGYAYGVAIPQGYAGGSLSIQVYDGPYCPSNSFDFTLQDAGFDTVFTVREPSLDPFTGAVIAQHTLSAADCGTWGETWQPLATFTPVSGQTYVVQVQTQAHSSGRRGGANNFALRAAVGGTFQACSGDEFETDPALVTANRQNCPNVFAYRDLSVFARSGAAAAEFFLASIGPEHSGKTLVIDLFDAGEGGDTLRVTDPNGDVIGPGNGAGITSFRYRVVPMFDGEWEPPLGWGPFEGHTIDISTTGTQPGPSRVSNWYYNERTLRIEIELPENIDAAYGGRTWWRIRYAFLGTVTDRTTWSVSVEGGPVRLIE